MTREETNKAIVGAVGPLKKLSLGGFQTTICGGPPPDRPVGEGLTDAAIDLLDLATQKPGIFINYKAPTGVELFHAGLLMIYVTGGGAYYEPTAIAKREGQAIVAERRRHAEADRAELKDRWNDFVSEPGYIRDLVSFDEVRREFDATVAFATTRPTAEEMDRFGSLAVAKMHADLDYDPEARP